MNSNEVHQDSNQEILVWPCTVDYSWIYILYTMIYKKYDRVGPSTITTIIISCLMSPDINTTLHFFMKYLRTSSKSLLLIFSYLTEKWWIFPFNVLLFFHVIEGKVFWNISQKQWICFFYRVIYLELIDFYTMYIQKTIGCTVVLT